MRFWCRLLLVLVAMVHDTGFTEALKCYSCSTDRKDSPIPIVFEMNYISMGLRYPFPGVVESCDKPNPQLTPTVDCQTSCAELLIDSPDYGSQLIRGCQEEIMGTSSQSLEERCETGTFSMDQFEYETVQQRLCSSSHCNNRTDEYRCEEKPMTEKDCPICDAFFGEHSSVDCEPKKTYECSGNYCIDVVYTAYEETHLDGPPYYFRSKGCTSFNPTGKSGCLNSNGELDGMYNVTVCYH